MVLTSFGLLWHAGTGFRFCKICNDILPLDKFYTHIKRYVCRAHHYERVRYSPSIHILT